MDNIAYQEALDYLYSFIDYSLTRNFRNAPEKFDLGRMHALLAKMGDPHRRYPVIHVAGTKGKGSVSAMTAAALQAAGYRVGLYTSPHLEDFGERIQVDGAPIPHAEVVRGVDVLRPLVPTVPGLTTFELMTALGFWYFADRAVDVAVVEVGLGGRLDATNVVEPLVSVITPISLDHTAILGDTLAKIAAEKGGIIKAGRPLVLAPQPAEARATLRRMAAARGAPLVEVGEDVVFAPQARSLDGQVLFVWHADQEGADDFIASGGLEEWEPLRLRVPLLGPHQVANAATAYAALRVADQEGLPVPVAAIQHGMAQTVWPARFEVLQRTPPLVVDGAHNRAAARVLRLTLDEYFPDWPLVLVFGASSDKDVSGMFAELLPRAQHVILTESVHPRALDVEVLAAHAAPYARPLFLEPQVPDALDRAYRLAQGDAVILVTGSLFVAAAARAVWRERPPVVVWSTR